MNLLTPSVMKFWSKTRSTAMAEEPHDALLTIEKAAIDE